MKLHHVGILTKDLKSGIRRYEALFDLHPISEIVEDHIQKVAVVLLSTPRAEGTYIELIAPLTDDSAVSNLLRKKTYLYHLCFLVEDIEEALERARRQGSKIISRPTPAKFFNDRKIAFIYTRDHYIVEFLEKRRIDKSASAGKRPH